MIGLRQQQRTARLNQHLRRNEWGNFLFPKMSELSRDEQHTLYNLYVSSEQHRVSDFVLWGMDVWRLIRLGLLVVDGDLVSLTSSGQTVITNETRRQLAHGQMFIEYHRAE